VFGREYHADTFGSQLALQPIGDLLSEPFLDLGTAGEPLDDSDELGQPKDALAGR
jgi:hypothetical protein